LATFNIEKAFVSKVIQDGEMSKEIAETPSYFFNDPDYRKGFEYILEYYTANGSVPTPRVFKSDCPGLIIVPVDEPWTDLHKRLTKQYVRSVLDENIDKYNAAMDSNDIDSAINFLGMTLSKVHTAVPHSRDVDVTENGTERLERYQERRDNPGTLVGVPSGFPTIDKATQGFQPGQLVTFTGLPKASKSTLALLCAMAIQEYGKRVLYLTYEQTVEEQERRLDAYRGGFNENLLNNGDISDEDWEKLRIGIHKTENCEPMMISEDCQTVTAVGAKIDQFKPDVVVIDGVYMMDDENGQDKESPQALTNIVSGLKFLAMNRMICIIVVTQSTPARTKGETLNNDSIMGSRAFSKYSNIVIGIERTDDVMFRKLKILLSRSCAPVEVMLLFDYDTGTFKELEGFDLDDDIDRELAHGEGFADLY
jgi:archaellum biogenesis ATPase FlaH